MQARKYYQSLEPLRTKVIDVQRGPRVHTTKGILWAFITYTIEREDGYIWKVTRYGVRD